MRLKLSMLILLALSVGCANQQTLERRVNSAVTLYVGLGGDKATERAVRVTEVANVVKEVVAPAGDDMTSDSLRAAVLGMIRTRYANDAEKRNQYTAIATVLLNELDVSLTLPDMPDVFYETRRMAAAVADEAIRAAKPFLREPA